MLLFAACFALSSGYAQKKVLSYPFEFEKKLLADFEYDTYFLDDPANNAFSLVFKDNKKVEYVLLDQNFKTVSKINSNKDASVFSSNNFNEYTGGTTNGHQYNFFYSFYDKTYVMETVDFDAKAVSHKKLIDIPKGESPLIAFSDNNKFYALTTNNKAGTLNLSVVNAAGELTQKSVPFPIPEEASRHRNKLEDYLASTKLMRSGEYPDLSNSIHFAKLFTQPDKLTFVINDGDNPAHLVSISIPDLTLQEKKIDYSALIPKDEKGKVYVSSFLKGERLFSLVLNKKTIRIVVNDVNSGAMLEKIEINDDAALDLFADGPNSERRYGKKSFTKDITDVKKLIKVFNHGTEGLMVCENNNGQLILTAGTYDHIPDVGGTGWQQSQQTVRTGSTDYATRTTPTSTITVWNPVTYYRPGIPGYTKANARYYTTTSFKILLDPQSLKNVRGRAPVSVPDQIKNYMEGKDNDLKATNQFSIGNNQYYGYYDKSVHNYVVEQIKIIQ
ncbi:hypothetical protein A4D02_01270 [Niastella koreensis]|nr:hypothetical protein A4D02_01270 [Niastella koreensis]